MVQFITHYTEKYSYLDSVRIALEGGCQWIQLRMKEASTDEILPIAEEAMNLCRQNDATFIIDDFVELAKQIGADGVHLGKKDMSIAKARKILGKNFIIGGTANTFEDILMLHKVGADYIGCGPFRFTTTKKNLSPILGLEGYQQIISLMKEHKISLPLVAIGGITKEDIPTLMQTGMSSIALSGSILRSENPIEEMKEIIQTIHLWKN